MTVLGGQRHAPHRPLKQLVRTDNVGAGRGCRGWVRELPGKVKGGERRWRGGEQTGVVVVGVGGQREAAWRCPEAAADGEESCDR